MTRVGAPGRVIFPVNARRGVARHPRKRAKAQFCGDSGTYAGRRVPGRSLKTE